jgi:hypothetical protein
MSFALFKSNMFMYMNRPEGIDSYKDFAKKITDEYDIAARSGMQTINNIPLSSPNKSLMEILVTLACAKALSKKSGYHNFIDDIGKGCVGYWTGATLLTGIPPIIPSIGAIQNITSTAAFTLNPGTWTPVGPLIPTTDINMFLDRLIMAMQMHLTTVSGLYITISMYPGFPLIPPAPGILTWTGFTIP